MKKIFLIFILILLNINLVKSFGVSPGIINIDYQQGKLVNLSFKIINIENESIKLKIYPSSDAINIIRNIEIEKNQKEKEINFSIYMKENLEDKIYIFIIEEEKPKEGIMVKRGVKLTINIEKKDIENYKVLIDKKTLIKNFIKLIIYGFYLEIIQKI
ncbi:MAG: hypothetical protein QXM27_01365 [Candidatus Pacearchaeota archaeon]